MRFEIGPGGMALILAGLAGLSCAVFGLGMVAGHELSGPEPGSQPVAAAYPLPAAAPASAPSAAAEASNRAPAAPASAGAVAAPAEETNTAAPNPPAKPAVASAPPLRSAASAPLAATHPARKAATSTSAVASRAPRTSPEETGDEGPSTGASVAPPSERASEPAETSSTEDEGEVESERPAPAPAPHRRLAAVNPAPTHPASGPYSVQIDAMMDRSGAEQMAQKMRAKGFEPYIVPTTIDGKTWYRLRVGHYATPEQAQAAESRLHEEFDRAPTGN